MRFFVTHAEESETAMLLQPAVALLIAGLTLNAHAQDPGTELKARIERVENGLLEPVAVRGAPPRRMRLTDRMRALRVPGVSIAVIDRGVVAWAGSYGVADVGTGRPVTADTLFQVASIGKPVVATLALRLAARGEIDLDEDVNRRLRQWRFPDTRKAVTARALLSHTAGVPAYGLPGYGRDEPKPTLLQVLNGAPPATNPPVSVDDSANGRYAYSSLGYVALQQYIVDAARRPFDVLAHDVVFAPLAMHDSLYAQSPPPRLAARAASGHGLDGSVLAGNWKEYPELAPAGLWSTANDLARFTLAIGRAATGLDTRLLSREQAKSMLTPVRDSYGLGFELDHAGAEPAYHHSGSNAGYKALLFAYAGTGKGAVILTNSDNGWMLIEEIARSIAAEYAWDDYRPVQRVAVKANTALFDRFSGEFKVSNTTLRISHDNGRLYVAGPPIGPLPAELIPAGEYDYFIREKDVTVHFDGNGDAPVETLSFVDGRPRKGMRVAPTSSRQLPGS